MAKTGFYDHYSHQKLTQIVSLLLACVLLSACVTVADTAQIRVLSSRGGQLKVIEGGVVPVLAVQSPQGFGQAQFRTSVALANGLLIELPGFQSMEELVLDNGVKEMVCRTGRDEKGHCRWGEDWPVAEVRRYPNSITVTIPAKVFQQPGQWTLRWVNEFR